MICHKMDYQGNINKGLTKAILNLVPYIAEELELHVPTLTTTTVARVLLCADDGESLYDPQLEMEYLSFSRVGVGGVKVFVPGRLYGVIKRAALVAALPVPPDRDTVTHVHLNDAMCAQLLTAGLHHTIAAVGDVGCWDVKHRAGVTSGRCQTRCVDEFVGESGAFLSIDGLSGVKLGTWITLIADPGVDGVIRGSSTCCFALGAMNVSQPVHTGKRYIGITIPSSRLQALRLYVEGTGHVQMFFRTGHAPNPFGNSEIMDVINGPLVCTTTAPVDCIGTASMVPSTPLYQAESTGTWPHALYARGAMVFANANVGINSLMPLTFTWLVPGSALRTRMFFAYRALEEDESLATYTDAARELVEYVPDQIARSPVVAVTVARAKSTFYIRTLHSGMRSSYIPMAKGNYWPLQADYDAHRHEIIRYGNFPLLPHVHGNWPDVGGTQNVCDFPEDVYVMLYKLSITLRRQRGLV